MRLIGAGRAGVALLLISLYIIFSVISAEDVKMSLRSVVLNFPWMQRVLAIPSYAVCRC